MARKRKPKTRVEKAQDKLHKALKRLDADQGRIARRNARAAVSAAQRQLKAAVNAEYPTIRKSPKQRSKLTPRKRLKRVLDAGYAAVESDLRRKRYLAAGIPTKSVANVEHGRLTVFVPTWAEDIDEQANAAHLTAKDIVRVLERAKKPTERRVVRAELAVRNAARFSPGRIRIARAITRIRNDRDFRNSILAAARIGHEEVITVVTAVLELRVIHLVPAAAASA